MTDDTVNANDGPGARISRRRLFELGTVGALAAAGIAAAESTAGAHVLDRTSAAHADAFLRRSTFAPRVNSFFRVARDGGAATSLKLVEVTDILGPTGKRGSSGEHGFSLLFRGRSGSGLAQGSYLLQHRSLGRFSLFITPVVTTRQGRQDYEAIVNRMSS